MYKNGKQYVLQYCLTAVPGFIGKVCRKMNATGVLKMLVIDPVGIYLNIEYEQESSKLCNSY